MEKSTEKTKIVVCEYCKEEINKDAKVCHFCSKDQRRWLNRIRDAAGPTAFAMVLIAVVQVSVSFLQVRETQKERIEAEEVLNEARGVLHEVDKVKEEAKSTLNFAKINSEKAIKESNLVLKKAEEKAKEAIEFARVAKDKADKSNEKITYNEKIYQKNFEEITGDFSHLKTQLAEELMVLQKRNNLTRLADLAIAECSRDSFDEINRIADETNNENERLAALSENFRVKAHYVSISRIKERPLFLKGKQVDDDKEIPTDKLIKALASSDKWVVRARSAQILGKRKEKNVAEALMTAIRDDKCLDVVKEAKNSFRALTKFEEKDVFQFEEVDEWWNINKEEYLAEIE